MGGDRTTRSGMPYGADQGYDQGHGDSGMPQGNYMGYGDGQPAGFNRHQSSNARRVAAQNPIKNGARRLGDAFSGLREAAAARMPRPAPRPSRAEAVRGEDGDYLGVGDPCRVCGNPVDRTQDRCPHCGAFVRPVYQHLGFIAAVVAAVVAIVLLSLAVSSCKSTPTADPTVVNPDDPTGVVVAPGDKSALTAAAASAQAILDAHPTTHTYTGYSIRNLQAAVNAANAVINNANATDAEVAQAAQAVSDAMGALVNPLGDYPWPMYDDLVANLAGYIGQQVAINGTTQEIVTDEFGMSTATMAVSGDPSCPVYIQYYADALNGELYVGSDFTALGTVSGDLNGAPLIFADHIDVL